MRTLDLGRARPRRVLAALAITLIVTLILAACGAASAPAGLPAGNGAEQPAPSFGNGQGTGAGSGGGAATGAPSGNGNSGTDGGGTSNGVPVMDAVRPDLLVIKTGILALEVEDVNAAVAAAATHIGGLGGYVSGSSQSGDADKVTASMTYRIPAARWEDALIALRGLATKVLTEQTQTDEVNAEVVDLGARVTNLQATERAVQAVMDRATTIDEILTVQAELTRIRGEIEAASSAKSHLQEQATFSTLTVSFGLAPLPEPSPTPEVVVAAPGFDAGEEVGRATESLVGILERLASVGIWFAIVWLPVLLVLGAIGLGLLWLIRRLMPPLPSSVPPGN